jgi:hypothetical protein
MTDQLPDRSDRNREAYLGALAQTRIAAAKTPSTWKGLTPKSEEAAAALLAELWAVGERHGVSQETWSGTTDLPAIVLSIVSWRARGLV